MNQISHKKIIYLFVPVILFFGISFAFPKMVSAQAMASLIAQNASCIGQEIGVDQLLNSVGSAIGDGVNNLLGIGNGPGTTNYANQINSDYGNAAAAQAAANASNGAASSATTAAGSGIDDNIPPPPDATGATSGSSGSSGGSACSAAGNAASNAVGATAGSIGSILTSGLGSALFGGLTGGGCAENVNVVKISDSTFLSLFTSANGSLAQIAGNSNAQRVKNNCTQPLLVSLARLAALSLMQNLTEATVNWINNGFNGNPAYVANIGNFLQQTGNQVVGNVLFNDPSLNFLCAPFQAQVKVALGLSYSQPFYKQINCTLTGALANIGNAALDFTSAAGWNGWLQLAQPQNNAIGAFLIAKSNIDSQISAKQAAVGSEISAGQGALSFETCDVTTHKVDAAGQNTGETSVVTNGYTGSPDYIVPPSVASANGGWITYDNCKVKTPGAIVTSQLAVNANSDQNILELQAALGDGVDQIFSALLNQLQTYLTDKINNGVLDTSGNAAYDAELNGLSASLQTNYNNGSIANPISNYNSTFGSGYSAGFNATPAATTTATGISMDDPFYSQKTNAISIINSILNFEAGYQNTFGAATNILENGRAVFANEIGCYQKLGDSTSYGRSISINANVISNIDQTPNYSRTIPQIPWTLPYLSNSIALSNSHVALLNAAENTITNATTADAITQEMNIINGSNFNEDQPLANIVSNISQWLTQMGTMYTSAQCPINLTSALSGAAPAPNEGAATSTVGTASSTAGN